MSKLMLNLSKMDPQFFREPQIRNFSHIKVNFLSIEALLFLKDKFFHKELQSSVTLEWGFHTFFLNGLKNDEQSLLNLQGLQMGDMELISSGDKVWKFKSCKISGMAEMETVNSLFRK